jgi:hypothetical protein
VDPIDQLRRIALALPGVSEKLSHGEPSFFCDAGRAKQFVMLDNHHHGADHLAFWCAAPPGAQEQLIAENPDQFFRPPYVGHRGWLGVRIDRDPDWDEIAEIVRDAYRQVAPKRLRADAGG